MSAAIAVFETTELLECIVARLSLLDIISSRLVCRKWNTVVTGSTYGPLREVLFFKPVSQHAALHWEKIVGQWCPRLSTGLPAEDHEVKHYHIVTLHPALDLVLSQNDFRTDFTFRFDYADFLSLPPGQWEDMLIMKPPCRGLDWQLPWQNKRELRRAVRDLFNHHKERQARLRAAREEEFVGIYAVFPRTRTMHEGAIREFFEKLGIAEDVWREWRTSYNEANDDEEVLLSDAEGEDDEDEDEEEALQLNDEDEGEKVVDGDRKWQSALHLRVIGCLHESSKYVLEARHFAEEMAAA